MKAKIALISLLFAGTCGAYSQGFINLNFEQATIPAGASGGVATSNAIPRWAAYTYGIPQTVILYDTVSLGAAAVSIHDTNGFEPILQGRYTVGLQGQEPGTSPDQSAAIAQIGQIPVTARSLTFWAQLGGLQITFNSQLIPFIAIGNGANYTVYGGDISAFAGQSGELRFTTLPRTSALIDNVQFSDQPIPEPGCLALFGVGTLLLGFFRRRNFSR